MASISVITHTSRVITVHIKSTVIEVFIMCYSKCIIKEDKIYIS